MWKLGMALALATTLLLAHAMEPERTVVGHTVSSQQLPKISIRVPEAAQYLGADRWILGGYDDCEMHLFVESDPSRVVKRLYWIQFEAYVPERPELHHDYGASRHITVGGIDFYLDTWVAGKNEPVSPGSDSEHEHELIRARGYQLPTDGMYVRLVHLPDSQKRHEVMIIYGENLAPTGYTAAELSKHGSQRKRWAAIETALIDRATASIAVQR
jgi:hypothetical protein